MKFLSKSLRPLFSY